MNKNYDYIVVGAGSAGCALAEALSRDPSNSVLLIEAGGKDNNPMIHIPLGAAALQKHKRIDWNYQTEPEAQLNNRRINWPRGRVLGGSSAINGMLYIRGQKEDYDKWAAMGNTGWSYEDLLPYFKLAERNVRGEDTYHGSKGPMWVDEVKGAFTMSDQFIQAGIEIGIPHNPDFNGPQQEGIGLYQTNIKNGVRQSSARAFIKPNLKRPNLRVLTNALTTSVKLENKRVTGINLLHKGIEKTVGCKQEVILCGGAINSPQLLELSGIGNPELLKPLGITVKHELPGVGENLQDHLTINICQGINAVSTYFDEMKPLRFIRHILRYFMKRRGLLASPSAQVGAFFKTSPEVATPDAQIHFAPAAARYNDRGQMIPAPGTTATVCYLRPSSRGSVHIQSSDPLKAPSIKANYLDTEEDRQRSILAVKKTRQIFTASILDKNRGPELAPGAEVQTDEEILEYIRKDAVSVYHPGCSCKMGSGPDAVVDQRLRVHGIKGLRIADASIMPTMISGNTHAICVAIAQKCADMVLEERG